MTDISNEEIAQLAKQAGYDLPPDYFEELADAYRHIRRLIARLDGPDEPERDVQDIPVE